MKPVVVGVDDAEEILGALRRQLQSEPYELRLTDDPRRVLEWIAEGRVDLVIADLRMPALSGVELLETVHDHSPGTALMLLSGVPDAALVLSRSELRVARLIPKPWDGDELRAAIRRALRREVRVDCAGRDVPSVIAEFLARGAGSIVVLERLPLLADSLTRLLKELPAAPELRDDSGCVAAFRDVVP